MKLKFSNLNHQVLKKNNLASFYGFDATDGVLIHLCLLVASAIATVKEKGYVFLGSDSFQPKIGV